MSTISKIEWTERTWNPVTGCTKISPGCKHCYAEVLSRRLKAMGAKGYENAFQLTLHPERLSGPLKRQRPTIYFVNSMSDLFHEDVPDEFIIQTLEIMKRTPQHTYQLLTKRAERLVTFFANYAAPSNLWLGVSVEDQEYGLPRIEQLRAAPGITIKFLSIEPLLEDLGVLNLTGIDWVIVGGESGFGARQMKQEWALNIKQWCEKYNVAFFFKQWGAYGEDGQKRNKKANGRILTGQTWDNYPVVRTISAATFEAK